MPTSRPDSDLVAASLRGDRSAFALLLDRHLVRVRALAAGLLPRHDAEDVAQEAVLQAYLGLDRLRDPTRFGSWLYGITLNLARMRLRTRATVPLDDGRVASRIAEESPEDAVEARELAQLVRDALEVLPAQEREALLLHYRDGLTSPQVASVLGERAGTVRVRLHRARRRLHERLNELAPPPTRRMDKEAEMVEVAVADVVAKMAVENGDDPLVVSPMRIVLLKEREGERVLPIWVGAPEGDALALQLGGEAMPRPLTADLMARLLEAVGAKVQRVVVSSLRDDTFYARVAVAAGGRTEEIDARPSDALNLATRIAAPIFVAEEVMADSITGDLGAAVAKVEASFDLKPSPPGEWRSLSGAAVKALHPPPRPRK
ncbi:MAG TPA: bifunctional nuclease domain-containing protein [Gaiellaceae bacterium]|nr:bifunctional nuclease domain-containing protein [Gaiellaceae bacterium]